VFGYGYWEAQVWVKKSISILTEKVNELTPIAWNVVSSLFFMCGVLAMMMRWVSVRTSLTSFKVKNFSNFLNTCSHNSYICFIKILNLQLNKNFAYGSSKNPNWCLKNFNKHCGSIPSI